jgi:putative membrane-bound dehydrogenase-like protein
MLRFPMRFLLLVVLAVPPALFAQQAQPLPPPPAEAIAKMKVAPGLEVQFVAAEPLVRKPVSITFDDRGRLWVLQYLQYPHPNGLKPVEVDQYLRTTYDKVPEPPPNGPKGRDRITILEDTDGDGVADRSKDFLNDLNLAAGMALGYDGVYVTQPPYLLYYPDKNHDDVPDGPPEVLLTGFGMHDAHAFANSLTWGPDGWLYGAQGSTVSAKIRGIEFQQGIWRYHPRTHEFELFAEGGGNTWGIDFDPFGRLFAGGNTTEPLCHHVQGAYYIKGFGKHGPLHNPYSFGYFPPVKHVGFLGSALTGGSVIYQGGLFPERFNDAVIYPNLRVNAMRVATLKTAGSTFETHFQEDFILSSDPWFRPADNLVGPDGALYLADWCDNHIAHSSPKNITQWYQPHETGRIWRVVPTGTKPQPLGKLSGDLVATSKLSSQQLVALLRHPNAWYWREALRILAERRDPAVIPQLETDLSQQQDERLVVRTLWALLVSGGMTDNLALKLLDHPSEHVRSWTIRWLGDQKEITPSISARFLALAATEPSSTVRSQLACTCKRLKGPVALPIVDQLCNRVEDLSDPHIPLLLWWAIEDKAISDRPQVLQLFGTAAAWQRPLTQAIILERLVRRYLAEATPDDFAACATLLAAAPTSDDRERLIRAMELQMAGKQLQIAPPHLTAALQALLALPNPSSPLVRLGLRLHLPGIDTIATERLMDQSVPTADRVEFVRTLSDLKIAGSLAAFLKLLQSDAPVELHEAVLQALQTVVDDAVPAAILARYAKLPPHLRDRSRDILVSRPAWSARLLTAVESAEIPAKEVSLDQVRRMLLHHDKALSARSEKQWGRVQALTSKEKAGRIEAVSRLLAKGTGDMARGKLLSQKHCQNCHQLFGEGQKVGPDLTAVDRKNLRILLQNVVDPSSVIREGFGQYVVETKDGLVLSGLIAESNAASITLLDAKNVRTTIPREKIEEMKASEASVMPESLLEPLSDQEIRDLFQFLQSEPGKK